MAPVVDFRERCITYSWMKKIHAVAFSLIAYAVWAYFYVPEPTLLSLRIGLPFEEVVRTSVIPPANDPEKFGITLVTKPAVVIKFSDPKYGFTLPATTFAGVSYSEGKVSTIRTSPMLSKLLFTKLFQNWQTCSIISRYRDGSLMMTPLGLTSPTPVGIACTKTY